MSLEELTIRVDKLEDLISDIPSLMSLRLESMQASLGETSARLNLIDKQLANLTRDVRDLRGAVTRQLLAQDAKLDGQDVKLEALGAKILAQDAKLDAILARLPQS